MGAEKGCPEVLLTLGEECGVAVGWDSEAEAVAVGSCRRVGVRRRSPGPAHLPILPPVFPCRALLLPFRCPF